MFDNGRLEQRLPDTSQGFGVRAVKDDAVGYAHSSDVSLPALIAPRPPSRPSRRLRQQLPRRTNVQLYSDDDPLDAPGFEAKVKLLAEIDAYLRDKDPRVRQVFFGEPRGRPGRWSMLRPDEKLSRHPPARARQRIRGRRTGRPPGRAAARAMAGAKAMRASSRPDPGARPPTARCARRWSIWNPCPRPRARWTSCWAPAGRA